MRLPLHRPRPPTRRPALSSCSLCFSSSSLCLVVPACCVFPSVVVSSYRTVLRVALSLAADAYHAQELAADIVEPTTAHGSPWQGRLTYWPSRVKAGGVVLAPPREAPLQARHRRCLMFPLPWRQKHTAFCHVIPLPSRLRRCLCLVVPRPSEPRQ